MRTPFPRHVPGAGPGSNPNSSIFHLRPKCDFAIKNGHFCWRSACRLSALSLPSVCPLHVINLARIKISKHGMILIERSPNGRETLNWNRWLVDDDTAQYSIPKYRYGRGKRGRSLKTRRKSHEYLNTMYKKAGIAVGFGRGGARTGMGGARTGSLILYIQLVCDTDPRFKALGSG